MTEVRDASLSVYLSTDHGGNPDRPHGCDWRRCSNEGTVLVHVTEVDDGAAEVYCEPHARVMLTAAVTRLWTRFGETQP
jgi:hypothetical protein